MAKEVGATDLLGVTFKRVSRHDQVVASHGVYIAIGRVDPAGSDPSILGGYDGPEPFAAQHSVEYLVLCRITSRVFGASIDSAVPGTIYQITENPAWEVEGCVGAGRLSDASIHGLDDAVRALRGDDPGQGQIKFSGSCNPQNAQRLRSFQADLKAPLSGNPAWASTVTAWIEDCVAEPGTTDLVIDIFNPCDLVGTLVHGWPERMADFTPLVLGAVGYEDGRVRQVRGGLIWESTRITDFAAQVELVYRDPIDWCCVGYGGERWKYDQLLLESLGLTYVLFELTFPAGSADPDEAAL